MDGVLYHQQADHDFPVIVFVHLACARVEYTDRGKSAIVAADALPIVEAVQDVTKAWRKQRIAEIKDHNAALRRRDAMTRTRRVTQKDAAFQVMEEAYLKASANGTLPAKARQIIVDTDGDLRRGAGFLAGVERVVDQLLEDDERPVLGLVPGLRNQLLATAEIEQPARLKGGSLQMVSALCRLSRGRGGRQVHRNHLRRPRQGRPTWRASVQPR